MDCYTAQNTTNGDDMAFNWKALTAATNILKGVAPAIKSWVFSDGKFQKTRAIMLAVFFALLVLSIDYIGSEQTSMAVKMLDDISDIVGYIQQ